MTNRAIVETKVCETAAELRDFLSQYSDADLQTMYFLHADHCIVNVVETILSDGSTVEDMMLRVA